MSRRDQTLSPQRRELLLDALRAPSGYELDCAVGTTFSVDLASALLVPMAFALFDTETGDIDQNPVAVLAATRTYAGRVALYCEQGRIAPAAKQPQVMAYLERMLRPVEPPDRGSFHPKLWVLRYRASNSDRRVHRVLCLSRNLTFDRSWDTIVRLEEAESGDPATTAPLTAFIERLGELDHSPEAESIARSLQGVAFDPPPGFEALTFHPLLGGGTERDVVAEGGEDLLVISPFLSAGRLRELLDRWGRVRLVSRPESLDRIDPDLLRRISPKDLFTFDSPALDDLPAAGTTAPADETLAESLHLSGLHAKVNAAELDGSSYLLLGSANATTAAFDRNMEFGVELRAKRKRVAPRSLLKGDGSDPAQLRTLLKPYQVREAATEETPEEAESRRLENLRREIATTDLVCDVTARGESYDLDVSAPHPLPGIGPGDSLACWPVTLPEGSAVAVGPDHRNLATFRIGALGRTTGLLGFRLKSRMRGVPEVRFTLLAELRGEIDGRLDAVMAEILSDRERLMRFLFLLLASGTDEAARIIGSANGSPGENGGGYPHAPQQPPLLETLLRTYSRDRGRLEAFSEALRCFERLRAKGNEIPEDILLVWRPIEEALAVEAKEAR